MAISISRSPVSPISRVEWILSARSYQPARRSQTSITSPLYWFRATRRWPSSVFTRNTAARSGALGPIHSAMVPGWAARTAASCAGMLSSAAPWVTVIFSPSRPSNWVMNIIISPVTASMIRKGITNSGVEMPAPGGEVEFLRKRARLARGMRLAGRHWVSPYRNRAGRAGRGLNVRCVQKIRRVRAGRGRHSASGSRRYGG